MSPRTRSKRTGKYTRSRGTQTRSYPRSSSKIGQLVNITRQQSGGFPQRLMCKLIYDDTYNSTTGGSGFDNRIYNLNSLYDPDRSATGHQPLGYDQLTTVYNRYRVLSCKVTVTLSGGGTPGLQLCLMPSNETVTITDYYNLTEQPFAVKKSLSTGGPPVTIKKNYSLSKIAGVSKSEYKGSDRYQGTKSSSPSEVILLHVAAQDIAKTASVPYAYSIKMEFIAEFFDPDMLPSS